MRTLRFSLVLALLISLLPFAAFAGSNTIYLIKLESSINPITKDYVIRSIERANREGAALLIIQLDTPGGLMSSMENIVKAIFDSKVPIVVFVGPAGSKAGSAGVFITLAADIAVMANGTNIGAAHPVSLGGESPEGEDQDKMTEKITNYAASYARSIAEKRGRNVEWAEKAVTESAAITATEALANNVIDLIADSIDELLVKVNGYQLKDGRTITTEGTSVVKIEMSLREQLLNYLADPNLVYVLFMIGLYALIYEFFSPGIGFGFAVGGISLLLAFLGLQILPVNIVGVALILFGALLMVLDVFSPTHGILTTGGVISLLAGSFTLFNIETPGISLSWWNIVTTIGAITALFVFVISKGLLIQRKHPVTGIEGMIGAIGKAKEDIYPVGRILVKGEYWEAEPLPGENIKEGDEVLVEGVKGRRLIVRKRQ